MAKKTVYLCDFPDCDKILIHPGDGFLIEGRIASAMSDDDQEHMVVVEANDDGEPISLCRTHLLELLVPVHEEPHD